MRSLVICLCLRGGGETQSEETENQKSVSVPHVLHICFQFIAQKKTSTLQNHIQISLPQEFRNRRTSLEMRRVKGVAAPARTSWTLVGPNSGKYYLVGPHFQESGFCVSVAGVLACSAPESD